MEWTHSKAFQILILIVVGEIAAAANRVAFIPLEKNEGKIPSTF